jgi:hypothetical protein
MCNTCENFKTSRITVKKICLIKMWFKFWMYDCITPSPTSSNNIKAVPLIFSITFTIPVLLSNIVLVCQNWLYVLVYIAVMAYMIQLLIWAIILNVSFLGLYSLRRLRLQDNLLQQLPEVLDDLEVLEQLSLRKNRLSLIPPKLLSDLKHLKHLDLSSNWISSVHVLVIKTNILKRTKTISLWNLPIHDQYHTPTQR